MEIYRINHICLNQSKTQFCLSYNKGIKIFNLKNFNQIGCSNSDDFILGDIVASAMFYELNLITFIASQNNKKLVLWDNDKKTVISSTQFKSVIFTLKALRKLIFAATKDEINICNLNASHNFIEIISKVAINPLSNSAFDVWMSNNAAYNLACVTEKANIKFIAIYENLSKTQDIKSIDSGFNDSTIQNLFYNQKLNMLFAINELGTSIKCFNCSNFSQLNEFYRGKNFAYISSIANIQDKYIAVASSNKTIHIYELNNESSTQSKSYFTKFYNFLKNPFSLNRSALKIRLNQILLDEEESGFFDLDFKTKGVLLYFDEFRDELICLGYNGTIYFIKIDMAKLTYQIRNKYTWCISGDIKNSLYISEESTFDLISVNYKNESIEEEKWKIV